MIHYLYATINDYTDIETEAFLPLIHSQKKERISRCSNKTKRKLSIISEILLKQLLEEHSTLSYDNLEIIYNENDKPYIKDNPIYFNISHAKKTVITVISDKEIGVDLQHYSPNAIKSIDVFASASEKAWFKQYNDIAHATYLFACKEAYIKCYGLSLKDINTPLFEYKQNELVIIDSEITFLPLNIFSEHQCILCMKR